MTTEITAASRVSYDQTPFGIGTADWNEAPDDDILQQYENLIGNAQNFGVNLIDTAPAYGFAEQIVGQLLASPTRAHWRVITKVGEDRQGVYDFSECACRNQLSDSLEIFARAQLDVALVHCDNSTAHIEGAMSALQALQKAKQAKEVIKIGVSTNHAIVAFAAVAHGAGVVMTANDAVATHLRCLSNPPDVLRIKLRKDKVPDMVSNAYYTCAQRQQIPIVGVRSLRHLVDTYAHVLSCQNRVITQEQLSALQKQFPILREENSDPQ